MSPESADADATQRVRALAEAALERKAQNAVALDVRELTSFADAFLLLTGTSDRHVRSVADSVIEAAKAAGARPLGIEGEDESRWILIDLGDVVVHVFQEEAREFYDLDRLWQDAPLIDLAAA
ncbi:MAG: ribosome silencing factor [Planctomycetota bacterium]|nr:ribosome silencing factor [Deltaproteobacteria bacterium]MDP6540964.1 ribosome silencing factor [Planctomycetota bacterium]